MAEANTSQILIKIYPNPTSDILNVELLYLDTFKPTEIAIIDQLGYIVFTQNITNVSDKTIKLNVSALAKGNYLLSVTNKIHYSIPSKLIIQ